MTFEKILIIDDDPCIRKVAEQHLRIQRYMVSTADSLCEARGLMKGESFDLLLLDTSLPDENATELLRQLQDDENAPAVITLGESEPTAEILGYLRAGASDYISKPIATDELDEVIQRAESHRHDRHLNHYFEQELFGIADLPGESLAVGELRAATRKAAALETTVLINGERGVGKGRVARALHHASGRAEHPFIRVNCASSEEAVIERELFGSEGHPRSEGRLELAQGGTLILEDVSELPPRVQVRLLRALQEGEYERTGCGRPVKLNARVIATTQRNLAECVARGSFRQDLLFALNVVEIAVPPLRERLEDIPALAVSWLDKYARRRGFDVTCGISGEALRHLSAYSWPGNLRELENALERAAILTGPGRCIEADALAFLQTRRDLPGAIAQTSGTAGQFQDEERLLTLDELEKKQVLRALERTKQNRTRAAALLDISVRTLRNKLHRYRAEAAWEMAGQNAPAPAESGELQEIS